MIELPILAADVSPSSVPGARDDRAPSRVSGNRVSGAPQGQAGLICMRSGRAGADARVRPVMRRGEAGSGRRGGGFPAMAMRRCDRFSDRAAYAFLFAMPSLNCEWSIILRNGTRTYSTYSLLSRTRRGIARRSLEREKKRKKYIGVKRAFNIFHFILFLESSRCSLFSLTYSTRDSRRRI